MILVGLGSNLPHCGRSSIETLQAAMSAVDQLGIPQRRSSVYRSEAWPDPEDPPYVNAVLVLAESPYSAAQLLQALHAVEAAFGRQRGVEKRRFVSRTLDLDLLAYGQEIIVPGRPLDLTLPHPGIAKRDFVLRPLEEVVPDWQHPETGNTPRQMLDSIRESGAKLTAEPVILED